MLSLLDGGGQFSHIQDESNTYADCGISNAAFRFKYKAYAQKCHFSFKLTACSTNVECNNDQKRPIQKIIRVAEQSLAILITFYLNKSVL